MEQAGESSAGGPGPDEGGGSGGAELAARLTRVEEHCGFTEHTVEQLSAEMAELGKRLLEVTRRVEAIERRLGELARAGETPARGGGEGGDPEAPEAASPT